MKNIKNLFAAIVASAVIIPFFNGCKKGTEDPFLSFRSRDKRVEGTWTLKSVDYSYSSTSTSSTTNTVNSDNSTSNGSTTYKVTYDGTNMTVNKVSTPSSNNYTDNYKQYDFPTSAYVAKTSTSTETKTEAWTTSYTITVSIYKDNTYSYTTTKKAISYSRTTAKTVNGSAVTPFPKDTSYAGTYDGFNYYATDEDVNTQVGTWRWADDEKSGEDKIIISAGPLSGFLVRLSNKELMIDHSFGGSNNFFVDDATYQNNLMEDNNTTQVQKDKVTYSTYNNSNVSEMGDGIETTTTTMVKKTVTGKSTWEKTDKKRKREVAEE